MIFFHNACFPSQVDWLRFVGLASLGMSDGMVETMKTVCEILAESADGTSASIKFEVFKEVYSYLAER